MSTYIETDVFQYVVLPIIYILIGIGFYLVLCGLIEKIFHHKKTQGKEKKRLDTMCVICKNIIKYMTVIFVILAILTVYHVDVKSILAGLGIGVAIAGLAFQDILKDLLAGISILLENQFEIGDNVEINGFRGDVVFIGLKTTRLKNYKGAVKIIANRNITEVINYSLHPSLATIEIPVSYEQNLTKFEKVLATILKDCEKKYPNLKGPIDILGVDTLSDSSVVYKISVLTKQENQFQIERQLKRDLKERLEKEGYSIPYPKLEVYHDGTNV